MVTSRFRPVRDRDPEKDQPSFRAVTVPGVTGVNGVSRQGAAEV